MASINNYRQMMAEKKFIELQKLIETNLPLASDDRHELLLIYFDTMKILGKKISNELIVELVKFEMNNENFFKIDELLKEIDTDNNNSIVMRYKSEIADKKGEIQEVYNLISKFLIIQFENKRPLIPNWLIIFKDKYFKNDFKIGLYFLSIHLMLGDLKESEKILQELLLNSRERSTVKGVENKLLLIEEVLKNNFDKGQLEIYQSYCHLYLNGISEKTHFKKVIEMIIYFDDFKFQTMVLDLLHKLNLKNELKEYAQSIKENKDYSFVYLDKYFSHLKYLFITTQNKKSEPSQESQTIEIETNLSEQIFKENYNQDEIILGDESEVSGIVNVLKYQDYSFEQLCEVVVGLIQLEVPKTALIVLNIANQTSTANDKFLKICYLKITCYLMLRDYRAVLDNAFQALSKAETQNDILSFLYAQAEAYIGLNEKDKAKEVLAKIISIDDRYRMARERLEKINEI